MTIARNLAGATALALTVAACGPTPPGGPARPSQVAPGAIVGGTIGGLAQASRGQSRGAVARGVAVGVAAGGIAGSLINQQRALQQAIDDPNVNVTNDGTNMTVVFPNAILFDTSSATLSVAGQRDVMRLAGFLRSQPARNVVVIGHTDSTGSLSYNQTLSEHRARAVSGTLIAGGVNPARVTAIGQGATRPLASNETTEGRANNRRVEVIIRPPS